MWLQKWVNAPKTPTHSFRTLERARKAGRCRWRSPGGAPVPVERCSSTPSPGFCCRRFRPDWALLPRVLALPSSWVPAAQPLLTP